MNSLQFFWWNWSLAEWAVQLSIVLESKVQDLMQVPFLVKEIIICMCCYTVKETSNGNNYNKEASTVNTPYGKEQYCKQI